MSSSGIDPSQDTHIFQTPFGSLIKNQTQSATIPRNTHPREKYLFRTQVELNTTTFVNPNEDYYFTTTTV